MEKLDIPEDNANRVLDFLLRQVGCPVSPAELAEQIGVRRSTIHNRRTSKVVIKADDMHEMAPPLDVPPKLFLTYHMEVIDWLQTNRSYYFRRS